MKSTLAAACVLLAIALGACQSAAESPRAEQRPPVPAQARRVPSNGGRYVVAFVPDPDPWPVNQPVTLTVWVLDHDGKGAPIPPGKVTLAVDAAMPEHQHGMTTEPVVHANAGCFSVSGMLLHMPGHWQLYFDVTRDGITERAQCDVTLE